MSWISKIFLSGVDKVVNSVGGVIDDLTTSDEERLKAKNDLEKILNTFKSEQLKHQQSLEAEITERHKNDMSSDSWLSKNTRPLIIIFLTVTTMLLAYCTIFILEPEEAVLVTPWLSLLQTLLITAYSFYFGSRGLEKVQHIRNRRKE